MQWIRNIENDVEGNFSLEKGHSITSEVLHYIGEDCYNWTNYSPYHANDDGLMINEYYPYTIKLVYRLTTDKGVLITKNDSEYQNVYEEFNGGTFYFELSEEQYNNLLDEFNTMKEAILDN